MSSILTALEAADEIGVDTEATGFDVRNGRDYLMGVCYSTEGPLGYIPFRHRSNNVSLKWVGPLFEVLAEKPLIWHNRKFDYHSIRTIGIDPLSLRGPQYDTLLIAHLIDEELPSKELDWLSKVFLGDEKAGSGVIKELGKIYGWGSIPPEVMEPYGSHDADLTRRLKGILWPKLVSQNLESLYWDTESPLTESLYKMEQKGVGTNGDLARSKAELGRTRLHTIRRQLGINPASTKDLGKYLLDELGLPVLGRTPKGAPSFAKAVMEQYDDILQESKNPSAQLVAEYRGWQKAVTSLYEPLLEKVGPDGRIRTSFKEHGTVTGRLSAVDPNLQQVPRGSKKPWNGNAKACFNSGREGYSLYGWDYSQIELRLAAAYGQESLLLAEFEKADADPFNVLSPRIFGAHCPVIDPDNCKDCYENRHKTKNGFVYPNLYGAGLPKIAATLSMPIEQAKPLYDRYKASISGITQRSREVTQLMEQKGVIQYWDGRKRHMRNKSDAFKAWNSLVQGGAAQLVKKSILRCEEFADDDCYPVLTVHDEITFVIRTEAIPDYEPKVIKAMTDWPNIPVTLAVEGKEWK